MTEKESYSLLLESRGVALFRQRVDDAQLEVLKQLTAHLTSMNDGNDDRHEIRDAPPPAQELARSVALICEAPFLAQKANGMWKLKTKPTGLLSGQAFSEQPKVPRGFTGFLVGDDLLLTTAHGISNVSLLRIVFDYILDANDVAKTTYSSDEVFTVKKVVGRRRNANTREDWLLLRLNRSPGRPFLGIESQVAPLDSPLWMLGHPLGLPMKFVDNAKVTRAGSVFFECDLDASWGNSGSLVESDGKVVGVLQGTAPGVDLLKGLWLWCPMSGDCPTFVTSSPAFVAAVTTALGP